MKRLTLITIVIVVGLLVLVGATTLFAQSSE
jgi:flagellar basal body-associated protein FliL